MRKTIHIGGASGYWGESAMATPQLLAHPKLDYLVYDYLAEITMSIMARMKAKDPTKGYATDFVDFVMKPFLPMIAAKGVKVIANAGGVNPESCGALVRELVKEKGLDLKVAVITGDDFMKNKEKIAKEGLKDMFSGAPFPEVDKIMSINAYLGAFPIAKALDAGADIVITGRCVDSAVTLGACIHEFGWKPRDLDLLASGSLAGHILECGPQATGGNFTDWQDSDDIGNVGYPICEISQDGSFVTTKPAGTGGIVNVGTVSEQMLYEIGDPQEYILPDVICDFSDVTIEQIAENRVEVSPAKGYAAPASYKTCLTYMDGFRAGTYMTLYGENATAKAAKLADAGFDRAQRTLRMFNLGEFTETSIEILGAGSQKGEYRDSDEVVLKIAAKHPDAKGVGIFLKELAGLGLATPPGLSGFTGAGRARPSPVVRLFSYLTPKGDLTATIDIDGKTQTHKDALPGSASKPADHEAPASVSDASVEVPLIKLAWGRSGDKGNKANIGIIARKPEYLPYIWAGLADKVIYDAYDHFMDNPDAIEKFFLPGSHSLNILIDNVLGGGGAASLRNDAQAKGYAQILLAKPIKVSQAIADEVL
ncbi:MAG: DUF1446 domain-containing protein [Hellea sp.]|nr:DUF1446 domain-containing protein [Hellea sp.]